MTPIKPRAPERERPPAPVPPKKEPESIHAQGCTLASFAAFRVFYKEHILDARAAPTITTIRTNKKISPKLYTSTSAPLDLDALRLSHLLTQSTREDSLRIALD